MNNEQLEALAREDAKIISTRDFRKMLTKVAVETALSAELGDSLEMTSVTNSYTIQLNF
tara:strand:+ start:5283 stop:5459 length:177 start_codon:yes stop_codon:yes gene_type:complete